MKRHVRRPPDLTSLFDVLFIVVFAALIRAAAVQHAAEHPPPPPRPSAPVTPPATTALRQRALTQLDAELAARLPLVVRIAGDGSIASLEADGRLTPMHEPLLTRNTSALFQAAYRGDQSADATVCRIAARQLGIAELSRYLVIIAPMVPIVDLPHAVADGLTADLVRCRIQQQADAALVDVAALVDPLAPAPPAQPARKP